MKVEDAKTRIRDAGLRATGPRVAVLQLLGESNSALTHADTVAALSDQGWDESTLYRNLHDLTEAGLCRRTAQGDRLWRFELIGDDGGHGTKHPHFICTSCGDVQCLPTMSLARDDGGRPPKPLRMPDVEIQVRGLCMICQ